MLDELITDNFLQNTYDTISFLIMCSILYFLKAIASKTNTTKDDEIIARLEEIHNNSKKSDKNIKKLLTNKEKKDKNVNA